MSTPITETEIVAYLDGALTPPEHADFEAALAEDPELQARVAELTLPEGALPPAFDAMLDAAPQIPPLAAPKPVYWPALAAGLAALVVAGGIGYGLKPATGGLDGWQDYVAAYHKLYVPPTLSGMAPDDAAVQAQLATVSGRMGLSVLGLDQIDGLSFRRAQELGYNGGVLIQVAYQDAAGTPFAFCIFRQEGAADTALEHGQDEGLQSARWTAGGYGFYLIGGQDAAQMRSLAEQFRASL